MFAMRLKNLRKEKGYTQTSLAEALNIANGTVGNWESGNRQPDHEMLLKIAELLNTTTDYLLGKSDFSTVPVQDLTFDDFTYAMYNETKDLTEEDKAALLTMAKVLKKKISGNEKCTDKIVELDNSGCINKDKLENEKLVAYGGKVKETQPPIDEKTTL